jgi:hypothetical protein
VTRLRDAVGLVVSPEIFFDLLHAGRPHRGATATCNVVSTHPWVTVSKTDHRGAPRARGGRRAGGLARGGVNFRAWLGTPCQRGFGFTRSVRIVRPEHIYVGAQPGIVGTGAPVYREDDG